jgi:hypothetical protein
LPIPYYRLVVAVALLAAGCGSGAGSGSSSTAVQEPTSSAAPQHPTAAGWRRLGSWSGNGGVTLTENFTSDSGAFRVQWETRNETKPGAGTLHVTFRSFDSGRDVIDAVDARGVGRGTVEVSDERPRWYYLNIESQHLEWVVTVEEPLE